MIILKSAPVRKGSMPNTAFKSSDAVREKEREEKFKIGDERLGRKWIKIEESVGS